MNLLELLLIEGIHFGHPWTQVSLMRKSRGGRDVYLRVVPILACFQVLRGANILLLLTLDHSWRCPQIRTLGDLVPTAEAPVTLLSALSVLRSQYVVHIAWTDNQSLLVVDLSFGGKLGTAYPRVRVLCEELRPILTSSTH